MPNWCKNRLIIEHDSKSAIDEFVSFYREGTVCDHYLPTPRNSEGVMREDWWHWRISCWGTKWDIGSNDNESRGIHPTVLDNQATMSFDSAWAPPIGLYKHLESLGFRVTASYFEPGMDFGGFWKDGSDEYYEGSENFPKNLVDQYCFWIDEEVSV